MDIVKKNKIYTAATLFTIVAVSSVLHFYRIAYPAAPVFDEAHFATYAEDYFKGKAFFDIHPPLGKLFYATALIFSSPEILHIDKFIDEKYDVKAKTTYDVYVARSFGDFPYLPLRSLSAFFGILLPLAFYFFLRTIGVGNIGAILGAFFISLENAVLVETRLILMNGMCLDFAFLGLAAYFSKKPIIAGILWGFALAVKLSAIVFLGVAVAAYVIQKLRKASPEILRAERRAFFRFAAVGFAILIVFLPFNLVLFSTHDRLAVLKSEFGLEYGHQIVQSSPYSRLRAFFGATLMEGIIAVGSYVSGGPHDLQSPWYMWPAKEIPMPYYVDTGGPGKGGVTLDGNPIVWYSSTLAVIFLIALLPRYLKNFRRGDKSIWVPMILFGGYAAALLPFITIVQRSTFLYHYFPALFFAVAVLSWFLAHILKLDDFDSLTKKQVLILTVIVVAVVAGFIVKAPLTYGL